MYNRIAKTTLKKENCAMDNCIAKFTDLVNILALCKYVGAYVILPHIKSVFAVFYPILVTKRLFTNA